MSSYTAQLAVRIVGDAVGAVDALGSTDKAAGGLMGKLKGFGPAGLAVGGAIVAGVAIATKALYDVGGVWDDVSDGLRVKTGQTGDQLAATFDSVKAVASSVPAEIEDIGTVVGDVVQRMDLSGKTLETVSSQYLEAGRILGQTVDVKKTSAAFNAFKIEGDGVVTAMDDLFRASQASGVSMDDIAATVQKAGPALQTLGFDFAESATMAGTLDKAGLNANATFAAMSKGMVTLAQKGEEPKAAFERVVGEIGAFTAAGDKAAALDLASKVFGTRGAAQFVAAVESGAIGVDDLMGAAQLTDDTILGLGQDTADAAEKWQILKNKALVALEPVGSAVFGLAGDALGGLVDALDGIDMSGFEGQLAGAGAALSGLGPVVDAVIGLVIELVPIVTAAFDAIIGIIGPALDLVSSIVSTVTAVIRGDWSAAWTGVQAIVKAAGGLIVGIVKGAIGLIAAIIRTLRLDALFTSIWSAGKRAVNAGISATVGFFRALPGRIVDGLSSTGSRLSGSLSRAWTAGKTAVRNGITDVVGFARALPGRIVGAIGSLGGLLSGAGRAVMDGFLGGLRASWGRVTDFVGGIADWIRANKGPIAYDRQILVPAGQAIMTGLVAGLQDQMPALTRQLGAITDTIAGTSGTLTAPDLTLTAPQYATAGGAGGGGRSVTLHVTINGALDKLGVAREIKRMLRDLDRQDGSLAWS